MASLPTSQTSPSLASSTSISTRSESDQQQMSTTRGGGGTTISVSTSLNSVNKSIRPISDGKVKVERSCAESEQQQQELTAGPVKKSYSSKTISKEAFGVLDELRKGGQLCDVTINVSGQEFKVHRVVLAATSPYFLAMFTGELHIYHISPQ